MLDPKSAVPQAASVPVGNSLVLPPDLQLAAPTGTVDAYQPNGAVASATPTAPVTAAPAMKVAATAPAAGSLYGGTATPAAPAGDIYAQYGISKTNPDGSQKSAQQLHDELSAAIVKKKQQTDPNYGTFANIGSIFKDQ